jgi:hypothetical protein
VVVSASELPGETGEHRLLRLRDRRRLWAQRGIVAALVGGAALAFLLGGGGEAGRDLFWMIPLLLVFLLLWYRIESAADAALEWLLRPVLCPLSGRGYSHYDDEDEPAPDYGMAEVIVEGENPYLLPEEEDGR